jgi:hypothetical protein
VSWQLPDEQSIVHGVELHDDWQLPEEQLHALPEHATACRGVPVPGSATAGPPFGEVPPPGELLDPPHATISRTKTPTLAMSLRMKTTPPDDEGGNTYRIV